MRPPLKFAVLEIMKEKKHATDEELIDLLNKTGNYSSNELNKALLDLEILGSITVRWVAKDKRRIELMESTPPPVSSLPS